MKIFLLAFCLSSLSFGAARRQDQVYEYVYDFSTSGGASGSIDITTAFDRARLPANALVYQMGAKVVTAFTTSQNASLAIGNTTDVDGYMQSVAVADLSDNTTKFGNGALIWDDSNDQPIYFLSDDAADRNLIIKTVGTITAGKMLIWLKYYVGSSD